MRFSFTEEQLALREGTRDVLEAMCTTSDLRDLYESDNPMGGRSAERWSALSDLGATALLASEEAGGLGFGDAELVGVLEEAGRVALPEALGLHAGVAVPILGLASSTPAGLLSSLVEQGALVSVGGVDVALTGPVVRQFDGEAHAERVPDVNRAHSFLLASASDHGVQVCLVGRDQCTITPTPGLDTALNLGAVAWTPRPENVIAEGDDAILIIDEIASRSSLVSAAHLCGVVDAMLLRTAEYAKDRQQFGVPIGSFQAVKHMLANVRVALEFVRPAVYRAAWSFSVNDDARHHDAALAKALASEMAQDAAATCLQVHGGIGYTWESDLQFYLKRCWALATAYGDAPMQRARALSLGLNLSQ